MEGVPFTSPLITVGGPQNDIFQVTESSSRNGEEVHQVRALIAFNQWFIVTYQIALLIVVLLFSLRHLRIALLQSRLRKKRKNIATTNSRQGTLILPGYQSSSSSSSSTLEGNTTPPLVQKREVNERTSLLSGPSVYYGHSRVRWVQSKLMATLMHQPRPLPMINKKLPSNATTLLVLTMLGLNVFYTFYTIPMTAPMSFVLGDRSGLLFVANLPWLYILSAKNQPLKHLTGFSYENINILHRRLGEVLCLLAVVHGASMVVAWWHFFHPAGMTLVHYLLLKIILLGIGALVAYEALYLTSLASFRQRWYELFLGLHVMLQTAALILLWFHHRGSRTYVAIALAIFLVDRVVFRFLLKTRNVRAALTVMADGETVLVSADWPIASSAMSSWSARYNVLNTTHGWRPSEHIFLTVPALAAKDIIQAHPFTIASAAPSEEHPHAWFNLIIRAHDGFSRDLLRHAQTHATAIVRLDGPYGSMHALGMLRSRNLSIVVAGGSGIAVAYPLLWSLLHDHEGDAEAGLPRRKVCLVWVVHEARHVSWLGQERLAELEDKGLKLVIPSPTATHGRPDMSGIVEGLAREHLSDTGNGRVNAGVVVSGPDGMNRSVRNTCASLRGRGLDVEVSVEQYAW